MEVRRLSLHVKAAGKGPWGLKDRRGLESELGGGGSGSLESWLRAPIPGAWGRKHWVGSMKGDPSPTG